MSPMLRGEAQPLPSKELVALRSELPRAYGEKVVPTGSGPYLVVRVPEPEPDFLRDVEAIVDVLPYRDLRGYRGVLLLGDRGQLGVSTEMLRTLFEGRRQAELEWVHHHRERVELGGFTVDRIPSDPQRRLRAVFRLAADRVADLEDDGFDALAELLPSVKRAVPGGVRPDHAYLISDVDHVVLDGAEFFSELERRRRRRAEAEGARKAAEARKHRDELEERHTIALHQLKRILAERGESIDDVLGPGRTRSAAPPAAASPSRSRSKPAGALPPIDVVRPGRSAGPGPEPVRPHADAAPLDRPGAPPTSPAALAPPAEPESPDDPRFAVVDRHKEPFAVLRHGLQAAGYRTKERLMVRDVPVALAAARPDGYPSKVLVTFHRLLGEADARALLVTSRSIGAELVLAVAEDVEPGVDRVVLATNLKVIAPEAVGAVRFQ